MRTNSINANNDFAKDLRGINRKVKLEKRCSIKKWMGKMYNVSSAQENVQSVKGKEASAETVKTRKENSIHSFMENPLWSTLGPLKRLPSIISSQAILGSASPVQVVI